MKTTTIAIIGEDRDAKDMLLLGLKEYPTHRAVLICPPQHTKKAEKITKEIERYHSIPIRITKIGRSTSLEEVFTTIRRIKEEEKDNRCIINVETDYMSSCLALSSAFVNGIQAIGVLHDKVIAYPIMKFSYYNALTNKKMNILKELYEKEDLCTLEELNKKLKISAPLLSYHINGNLKSQGLKEMGLVETQEKKGRLHIGLSTLGKLLVRGEVSYECPTCVP